MDLVIMAAGMGSRFGGLKQIEPIDEFGNFIIDYSVFDAIEAGFDRVVFIIKEENYEIFKDTIGRRIEGKIAVEYVFQGGVKDNPTRTKPWGTAHAILCCKDAIRDNFAIINADDFYGKDAYKKVAEFLKNNNAKSSEFALIGYHAENTLSENGSAKRGICKTKDGYLTNIIESSVEKVGDKILATPLLGGETCEVAKDQTVSMNMFAFTPALFDFLQSGFNEFLRENKDNLEKCEYLIPEVVRNLIDTSQATVKVIDTSATWYGVTYKEDKDKVVSSIKALVDASHYPKGLFQR